MVQRPNISEIYDSHIADLNRTNQLNRYSGQEHWFHASAAGMCKRKIYFESIVNEKPAPKDSDTLRLFRLGDIVHGDIQDALRKYADLTGARILIEKEIQLPELNVRGFFDFSLLDHSHLYDIKTCNSFKWRKLFGRDGDATAGSNYSLQLGTYGIWIEQEYGELDGMSLVYYNKDTSKMREVEYERTIVDEAKQYWLDLKSQFKDGMPEVELGNAPMQGWECNPKYCSYFNACGGGLRPELLGD